MATATKAGVMSVEDVNKTLEDTLDGVFKSDRFMDLLNVMSKMKSYSLNNTLLIVAQQPQSTMVMGYKEWQKLGRFVEKGEKGIKILAPLVGKVEQEKVDPVSKQPVLDSKGVPETEEARVLKGFRLVSVFDVSQTNGKEIPSVRDFISREMANDDYMSKLYQDYKTFLVDTKEVDISEKETEKGVGGYFNRETEEIVISSTANVNDTEKFRVLIHEYAHALLHNKESTMKDLPRQHKEAQAESVAYVVSNYYGLDSSAVSAGYIATWSQDMKLAKQALQEVQEVANTIIEDIDQLQKEKIKSFFKDQEKDYQEAQTYLIDKVGLSKDVFEPNQQKQTHLQLINIENGYMLSGKLEYNPKNENFYLRTNRNLIEPLSELSRDGKLRVLNVEKELDVAKDISAYTRVPEHFEVKKVRNGPYLVQSANGENIISKGFEKKTDAKEFHLKIGMAQALHESTMYKRELKNSSLNTEINQAEYEISKNINQSVGDYLSHFSKKPLQLSSNSSITVGWTLLKNPSIKTLDDLKEFSEKHKHVPTYTKLPEALKDIQEVSKEKKENTKIEVVERELVVDR